MSDFQIWKEKRQDLWLLFTNWGRIGDYRNGQYQNTPFGTAQQAIDEFKKVFKSKTGNEWKDRAGFEAKAKKYRLVDVDLLKRVKREALKFNLSSEIPCSLSEDVQVCM